ncbi:MAG: MBL fold metallo-hydrolase [Candidatus Thiodiazotropha sp.]|nr:MBL fold metallo-hydrolase [Candidatus Thiodiazotropha sp.]MCM8884641.1 MBL fold metallo-hydrolase [Candidatus Thiodiazotropha sp.]MCM8920878.1 MBL fold metallo-hydrolase [Candidatus Thiodiazotropha sp.]
MVELNTGIFTLAGAQQYLEREPELHVDQLSARIWTVCDGVRRTLFVEADSSVIAFDTLATPGAARAYRKAITAAIPGKPVQTIIYSHDHLDHAGFAADLAPDADIIADEMCAKVIGMRKAKGQLLPTQCLSGKRNRLMIDGVGLMLLNPGPTHGTGNLSAYFEHEKILFSSDTLLPNARYGLLPDYHIWNLVRFMRELQQLDWNTFVPGRYEVTDRARFEKGCDFFVAVKVASQQAFAEFVPIWVLGAMEEYVGGKLREQFGDLDGFDENIGLIAIRIVHHYLMGGWGLEDTWNPGVLLADSLTNPSGA